MLVIIAVDALEHKKVEQYNCTELMQTHYGKTDITGFSEPRTMVLWSSFITGENKEKEVLKDGNKEMWNKLWSREETFFSFFKNPEIIDLPGYSYDLKVHEESRRLLKTFFSTDNHAEKEKTKTEYNKQAFEHHKKVKNGFYEALGNGHDLVLGYFSLADVVGHLSFGNGTLMKMIYKEFDEITAETKKRKSDAEILILSDHGMEPVGMFGDHSEYGFWSSNKCDFGNPGITDFYRIVKERVGV